MFQNIEWIIALLPRPVLAKEGIICVNQLTIQLSIKSLMKALIALLDSNW